MNQAGQTALDIALEEGHENIINIFNSLTNLQNVIIDIEAITGDIDNSDLELDSTGAPGAPGA